MATRTKSKSSATKDVATTKPVKASKPAKMERGMSALGAAAKVLGEVHEPLSSKALIEAMAAKGYWTSPGGKTPQATLYAALLREINTKGTESRFVKVDRGRFALNTKATKKAG